VNAIPKSTLTRFTNGQLVMPIHFDPRASKSDKRDLFFWFFCLASERDMSFRPRLNLFTTELVTLFLSRPPSRFTSESLRSLHPVDGHHEIRENLYLFTSGTASPTTTPDPAKNSREQGEIVSLLDTTNPADVRRHDLSLQECLEILRRTNPLKDYSFLILRLFRQIHVTTRDPEERLRSSGSLILCLVQIGAILIPGKRGARIAVRLIKKSWKQGMVISKSDLSRVQNLLSLQAKTLSRSGPDFSLSQSD
jgi:hypothetical protein